MVTEVLKDIVRGDLPSREALTREQARKLFELYHLANAYIKDPTRPQHLEDAVKHLVDGLRSVGINLGTLRHTPDFCESVTKIYEAEYNPQLLGRQ